MLRCGKYEFPVVVYAARLKCCNDNFERECACVHVRRVYLADILNEKLFRLLPRQVRHLEALTEIAEHSRTDPQHVTANKLTENTVKSNKAHTLSPWQHNETKLSVLEF